MDVKISDHYPIVMSFEGEAYKKGKKSKRRNQLNFKKANWEVYRNTLDSLLSIERFPDTVESAEKFMRDAIHKVTNASIPTGRHHEATINLPSEIRQIIKQRDEAKEAAEIQQKNEEVKKSIENWRRKEWNQFIAEDKNLLTGKLWKKIKKLNGKTPASANPVIRFEEGEKFNDKAIADSFNKFFANSCPVEKTKLARKNQKLAKKFRGTFIVSRRTW